jgi:hypothetical protein
MESSYQGMSAREQAKGGSTSDRNSKLPVDPVMQAAGRVRIGDLLADSGLVSMEVIQRALGTFEEKGLPVGRMLVNSGYITESQLRNALEIQNVINNGQLPLAVGTKVLALSFKENRPLVECFEKAGIVQPQDHLSNKLGQILLDSGVVTAAALDQALEVNQKIGLPLGHILCYRGVLSQQLLETSLLGQQLVRRASITREQCIKAIGQAYAREKRLEVLPVNSGYSRSLLRNSARIGELLFEAGLVEDSALLESLQVSLATARPAGQCLVEVCGISPTYIAAAVELQEMLDNGMLTGVLAQDTLIRMHGFNLSFAQALAEASVSRHMTNLSSNVLELLIISKKFSTPIEDLPGEVKERLEVNYNQAIDVCRLLLRHGLMAEHPLYAALRLVYLVEEELISKDQALELLEQACSAQCSVDEAIYQRGLKKRTRLRDE